MNISLDFPVEFLADMLATAVERNLTPEEYLRHCVAFEAKEAHLVDGITKEERKQRKQKIATAFLVRLNKAYKVKFGTTVGMQTRLAEMLNISTAAVSKWYNLPVRPSEVHHAPIAQQLGVREEWLVHGTGAMKSAEKDSA
jgi:hypothetical protein